MMALASPSVLRGAPPVYKTAWEMSEVELAEALQDPHWRIRNLYWVLGKDGFPVLFEPWPEQDKFIQNMWWRNVVPKARQRGFSTVKQLMMLDAALFVPDSAAAIIAVDDATSLKIFETKVKFAWNRLPGIVREMVGEERSNMHELKFKNGSSIYVATSTRGGTLQWLHVSEYGKICAQYPARADEIMEGSLPSAEQGTITVESTVETPTGHFSNMVRQAERLQLEGRPLDRSEYKLHFASWWDAPEYETDPTHIRISPQDNAYFHRVEAEIGRPLSPAKRAWWVVTRDSTFGGEDEKMFRQYPSTLKEAFSVSSAGLWLAKQMANVRRDGRICPLPYKPDRPVFTVWDLGTDDDCAIWFGQEDGPWVNWIDYEEASSEPPVFFVKALRERLYHYGRHYLPHDGSHRRPNEFTLKSWGDMLYDLGLRDIFIVPRIQDVTVGIDQMRAAFPTYRFEQTKTKKGVEHLDGFSKVWSPSGGTWSPTIAKNGHQHAADALRQHGQMRAAVGSQQLATGGSGQQRPNRKNRSARVA